MRASARVFVGALVLGVAACDHAPVPTPTAPAPIPSAVASVTISGLPTSLTVGQSVQLTASVTLADGTRSDATAQVAWQSSDVAVATVSSVGLLRIATAGDADITAILQGVQGRAHVSVPLSRPIPQPTGFDISGVVHESPPTEDVPVSGATVGIHFVGCSMCPHDNEATTTDANGRFTLRGLETAGFSLVVSKPGFETTQSAVVQLPRDSHPDIAMLPEPGQITVDITGLDICVEHPRDPFITGDSLFAARTIAVFDAHRDGMAGIPRHTGSFSAPFSDGVGVLVYSISSSGHAVRAPTPGLSYPLFQVTGGTRYYFVAMGDLERCRVAYRIPFTYPR